MSGAVSGLRGLLPHQGWFANPFRKNNDMMGLYPKQPEVVQPAAAGTAPPPTDYSVKTRTGGAVQAATGLGYVGLGNAVDMLGKSTKRNTYATQDLLG